MNCPCVQCCGARAGYQCAVLHNIPAKSVVSFNRFEASRLEASV